ncbi:uncharacterized protein LOC116613936 [Nematostella vectensis]|uniref:uncharacterized protein LOC116613936 n=1 Tax=Nematostella vectensis TaxID=45351 RepID=UPI002076FD5C|nr:uncharacterized protein LOC116613936 [Nematostella vectensis]
MPYFSRRCFTCFAAFVGLVCLPLCDGVQPWKTFYLDESYGYFNSPGYIIGVNNTYSKYPANTTVEWVIGYYRGYISYVAIEFIDLGKCNYSQSCSDNNIDTVRVFIYNKNTTLRLYCGGFHRLSPSSFRAPGREILAVRFKSVDSPDICRGKGFRAFYQTPWRPLTTRTIITDTEEKRRVDPIVLICVSIAVVVVISIAVIMIYCCSKNQQAPPQTACPQQARPPPFTLVYLPVPEPGNNSSQFVPTTTATTSLQTLPTYEEATVGVRCDQTMAGENPCAAQDDAHA